MAVGARQLRGARNLDLWPDNADLLTTLKQYKRCFSSLTAVAPMSVRLTSPASVRPGAITPGQRAMKGMPQPCSNQLDFHHTPGCSPATSPWSCATRVRHESESPSISSAE